MQVYWYFMWFIDFFCDFFWILCNLLQILCNLLKFYAIYLNFLRDSVKNAIFGEVIDAIIYCITGKLEKISLIDNVFSKYMRNLTNFLIARAIFRVFSARRPKMQQEKLVIRGIAWDLFELPEGFSQKHRILLKILRFLRKSPNLSTRTICKPSPKS